MSVLRNPKEEFQYRFEKFAFIFTRKHKEGTEIANKIAFYLLGICGVLIFKEEKPFVNLYLTITLWSSLLYLFWELVCVLHYLIRSARLLEAYKSKEQRLNGVSGLINDFTKERDRIQLLSRWLSYIKYLFIIAGLISISMYIVICAS